MPDEPNVFPTTNELSEAQNAMNDMQKSAESAIDRAVEETVHQAHDFSAKAQNASQRAGKTLEDNTRMFETVASAYASGVTDFQKKAMEFAQKNLDQAFALGRNMLAAREFRDIMTLQQTYIQDQTEAFKSQSRELNEIAVRISTETAKPIQETISKSLEGITRSFAA